VHDDLLDLEHRGWQALATSPAAATELYGAVLADDATFLFPGGMVVTGRDAALSSLGGPPWDAYGLDDERVIALGPDTGAVVYRARAERAGQRYEALVTSVYRSDGDGWRLVLHQQTPV
jgi:hypothetical protein